MNSSTKVRVLSFHPRVLFLFLLLALALAASGWYARNTQPYMASLTVDFGNGYPRVFKGETIKGMTITQALAASAATSNLKVVQSISSSRILFAIGETQDMPGKKQWVAYRNGVRIGEAFQQARIFPGDAVLLRFE